MNIVHKRKKLSWLFFRLPLVALTALYLLFMRYKVNSFYNADVFSVFTILKYYFAKLLVFVGLENGGFNGFLRLDIPPELLYEITIFRPIDSIIEAKLTPDDFVFYIKALEEICDFGTLYSTFYIALISIFIASFCLFVVGVKYASITDEDKIIDGVKNVSEKELCKLTDNRKAAFPIYLASGRTLYLCEDALTRHCIIIGSTGSGKSVLLSQMLNTFLTNYKGLKCVIVDVKGEFISQFYRPERGDKILNFYDDRSVGYNFFNDLDLVLDYNIRQGTEPPGVREICDAMADVAGHTDRNGVFYQGASNIFFAAIMYCCMNDKKTPREFIEFLQRDAESIAKDVDTLPAAFSSAALAALRGAEDTVSSMMLTMKQQLKFFSSILEVDGDFSISKFMHQPGNLFLSRAGIASENLEPIFKLVIDMFMLRINKGPEARGQLKYLLVMDEFGDIPKMKKIDSVLSQARSKGCFTIIANQSTAKMRAKYGVEDLKDMLTNINTRFFFRVGEADEAEYITKSIGRAKLERTTTSDNTMSGGGLKEHSRSGEGESQQVIVEETILRERVKNLPVGTCICDLLDVDSGKLHAVGEAKIKFWKKTIIHDEFIDRYERIRREQEQEEKDNEKNTRTHYEQPAQPAPAEPSEPDKKPDDEPKPDKKPDEAQAPPGDGEPEKPAAEQAAETEKSGENGIFF